MEERCIGHIILSKLYLHSNTCKDTHICTCQHPTELTECQAFSPVVRIGSPRPPHLRAIVAPPPLLDPGGDTPACGRGGEGIIRTKGQTLWYSTRLLRSIPSPSCFTQLVHIQGQLMIRWGSFSEDYPLPIALFLP
jgi:hypothetical protein